MQSQNETPSRGPARHRADGDALAAELRSADPRPTLDRARSLAHYAQVRRAGGAYEAKFAWSAFQRAGGGELSAWQGFLAGLAAQVEWLER